MAVAGGSARFTFDLDEYVDGALKAGTRGFLLKEAGPDLLTQAIHAAANGDATMASRVNAWLLAAFARTHRGAPSQPPLEPLTNRAEQVVASVAQGWTNHEIVHALHISISTVKTHLASLMRKLNTRTRVEIAMWAYGTAASRSDDPRAAVGRCGAGQNHDSWSSRYRKVFSADPARVDG